jgi:hypothetical protein
MENLTEFLGFQIIKNFGFPKGKETRKDQYNKNNLLKIPIKYQK